MERERHQRLLELFAATYELPERERAAVLDRECGDDESLRQEIEGMLARHGEPSDFLYAPALGTDFQVGGATIYTEPAGALVGQRISQYEIKRVIATGGMGTVYEAEQEQPHRTVALKVMRRGIASPSALRRFEHEAQILARLQHEGIAQVYEAGTYGGTPEEGGVPFFAMEHIAGARPITTYAREEHLDTAARLALFLQVCEAVHHGHQKGIIHRDLKPANILVNGTGQPKIIDFGVARATDSDVAITTMRTDVGQLIGTLQYMSPEQCAADPHDLDLRSDVYALGVVLYELLCDQVPYDVSDAALHEAARVVQEATPVRPSTVNRTLRGDLETITLKTLEKERERRYGSAAELAQDIKHYLDHEPIIARPPSALYHVGKFVRRNRALAAAAAAVFVVLVAWGGTASWQASVARTAQRGAETARDAEAEERARAEEETALARAVHEFMHATLESIEPGREVTMREYLDLAGAQVGEAFPDHPLEEAEVRWMIVAMYRQLGDNAKAEPHARAMAEIFERELGPEDRKTLIARNYLALSGGQGPWEEEATLQRDILEKRLRLFGPDHPETLLSMNNLAMCLRGTPRDEEAEPLLRASLEGYRRLYDDEHDSVLMVMNNLALALSELGRHEEAEALHLEGLEIKRRTLGNEHQHTVRSIHNLAHHMMAMGKREAAERLFREALEICPSVFGPEHPNTVTTMSALGWCLTEQGEWEEAEQICRDALELGRSCLGDEHHRTVTAMSRLAGLLAETGRLDQAEQLARKVVEIRRRLLGNEDRTTIVTIGRLAWILWEQGKVDEAEARFAESIELGEEVFGRDNPTTLTIMNDYAQMLRDTNRRAESESLFREVLELRRAGEGDRHPHTLETMSLYAEILVAEDRPEEAEPLYLEAAETTASLYGDEDARTQEAIRSLIDLYETLGRPDQASRWRARLAGAQPDES